MPRPAKPNTAEVTIRFRVPKGVSAARARRAIWNNVDLHFYPDDDELGGLEEVTAKVGAARIIRGKA